MFEIVTSFVEICGLSVAYEATPVLRDVSWTIRENEFLVLTGPSGCGKSTFANAVASALPPRARVNGEICIHRSPIALIWQEPSKSLSPMRRVGSQIGDVLEARGATSSSAAELLAHVGLPDHAQRYPHQLSQGQLQRVALARALAMQPALLVADEPTGSLDEATELEILALVSKLRQEHGFAVLWITHRPEPVAGFATSFWTMKEGKIWPAAPPSLDTVPPRSQDLDKGVPLVTVRVQSHRYRPVGEPVLRDLNLALYPGMTTAVLGRSGAGKSTLARIIAGIDQPDSGCVERNAQVSFVWPDPNTALNPEWRVDDAIAEPLQVIGVNKADRRRQAMSWMERLQIPATTAHRRVTELSGGQRRRVLIARAMIGGSKVIVFDEATNGLDPDLSQEIIALLRDLQRHHQLAYLWITHDQSTLPAFAHKTMRLEGGTLHNA